MIDWLMGVPARRASDQHEVYKINISGYGPADVGSFRDLEKHLGVGSGMEKHHIVEGEHLEFTRFAYRDAPAVAIPASLHRRLVTPRFTAEVGLHGGRRSGQPALTRDELLDMYRQVYTWHTPFAELYTISRNVIA